MTTKLTRKQTKLLDEVDDLLRCAPHLQRVSLYPQQMALWKEILKRMQSSADTRFDFDGARYRGVEIVLHGEEP